VLILLASLVIITVPSGIWAEESSREDRIFTGELPDISKLLNWFEHPWEEDMKWAAFNLKLGHRAIARGQWSAASKAFAGAAMNRPTPRTLLNLAYTSANMRTVGTCQEEVEVRLRIVRRAFAYFSAGLQMHKIMGSKSDLDDAAIIDFHKKMLDAQKQLLDFQRKCCESKASRGAEGPQSEGDPSQQ